MDELQTDLVTEMETEAQFTQVPFCSEMRADPCDPEPGGYETDIAVAGGGDTGNTFLVWSVSPAVVSVYSCDF